MREPGLPRFSAVDQADGTWDLEYRCPPGCPLTTFLDVESTEYVRRSRWARRLVRLLAVLRGVRPFPLDVGAITRERVWIDHADGLWLVDLGLPSAVGSPGAAPSTGERVEAIELLEELMQGEQRRLLDELLAPLHGAAAHVKPESGRPPNEPQRRGAFDGEDVRVSQDAVDAFIAGIVADRPASISSFLLRQGLDEIQTTPDFDTLLAPAALGFFEPMPHQVSAAKRALGPMRGRALLADQVGLGKTIEAGLCIKELLLRKRAERILILCPGSLARQWQIELYEKFDELFLVMGQDIDTSLAWRCPRLISPFTTIEGRVHAEALQRQEFDLVVVDEAHFLNEQRNWRALQVVRGLRRRFFLLLSATPMHNELEELYNIITLLKPGHFPDKGTFVAKYVDGDREHGIRNAAELRGVLAQVMIRNLRSKVEATHPFPKRKASHTPVTPTDDGLDRYQEFARHFAAAQANTKGHRMPAGAGVLAESICSSGAAFRAVLDGNAVWLERRLGGDFVAFLECFSDTFPVGLIQPKQDAALALTAQRVQDGSKVLVFSQFNETAKVLYDQAKRLGLAERVWLYDEDDSPQEKAAAIRYLRAAPAGGALFCPAEASEGLNLQFASVMVNYDLPWDPMKIEQRIGRIQRIGGAEEVEILNLYLAETIEARIIDVLDKKLRMFEAAVGEVEEVLGQLGEEEDIRSIIGHIFAEARMVDEEGVHSDPEERLLHALETIERRRAEESDKLAALDQLIEEEEEEEEDDDDDW